MKNILYLSIIVFIAFMGCDPYQEADINLGQSPSIPDFSIEFLHGDSNTIIVTDLSQGNFARIWDFGENADGNRPIKQTSTLTTDTVQYSKAGSYTITLHVSAQGGGGTAQNSKTITIANDAQVGCEETIALLTGDCLPAGKCWTFSQVAGAVTVGPNPGDGSWHSSSEGGLEPAQYDDAFCFFIEGASFRYMNNGQTIDPWDGYQAVDYTPPTDHTWTFSPGTGNNGMDQIILTTDSFLGVWDASNVYDIVSLTETELVVQTPFLTQDNGQGWFELYFVAL